MLASKWGQGRDKDYHSSDERKIIGTLDTIQALSNERQALWRLAGKQKWTPAQRERVLFIGKRLETLWDTRRRELAEPDRTFIEDRIQGDLFRDFTDLQRQSRQGVGEDEWDGFHIEMHYAEREREPDDIYPQLYVSSEFKTLALDVLREVLTDIRREDQARRQTAERALRHQLPLRQLRDRQRFLTGAL